MYGDVARNPGSNDCCCIIGIGRFGEEMIRLIEGRKALGVSGCRKGLNRPVNGDYRVAGRSQDKQRPLEIGDARALPAQVRKKLLADR